MTRLSLPVRVLVWVLVTVLLYAALTFVQVAVTAVRDQSEPSDAILVLGAAQYQGRPSPVFAARLDHAADLYAEGLRPSWW